MDGQQPSMAYVAYLRRIAIVSEYLWPLVSGDIYIEINILYC